VINVLSSQITHHVMKRSENFSDKSAGMVPAKDHTATSETVINDVIGPTSAPSQLLTIATQERLSLEA
jgi:hypothetical protein